LEKERKGEEAFLPYHLHCHHVIIVTIVGVVLKGVKEPFGAQGGGVEQWVELRAPSPSLMSISELGKACVGEGV
jgi:hypothetical protein